MCIATETDEMVNHKRVLPPSDLEQAISCFFAREELLSHETPIFDGELF